MAKLVIAISQMSVKGGDLPDTFQVKIDARMDFTGVSVDAMARCCASGQSARVRLQAQLRKKSTTELQKLELTGLDVHFNEIASVGVESPMDTLMKMTRDEFVEHVMDAFDIDVDECHEIYNRKHGLDPESRE